MNNKHECEHALIARVKAGDHSAFNQLVGPCKAKLMWNIMRIVHDPVEAEDVLQDSLIRAYRAIDSFREDASFYTWMFRICANTALATIQRQQRRRFATTNVDDVEEVSDIVTPEEVLICKQLANRLEEVFDSLAPEQSKAITLHELDGMSYQEIADTMMCPIGTVRSRISNARIVLAARLEPGPRYT